jgi:hypothetical protein
MCLAWFHIPDTGAVAEFKDLVLRDDAVYEGYGTDLRDGHLEGFAIFSSKKKMESFAKRASKHEFHMIGSVD